MIDAPRRYAREQVYALLRDYQRWVCTQRVSPREDRLSSRSAPLNEAPWSSTATAYADLEQALQRLPFQDVQVTWMVVVEGNTDLRFRRKDSDWKEAIADWWGTSYSELGRAVAGTIDQLTNVMNGDDITNNARGDEVLADTVEIGPHEED